MTTIELIKQGANLLFTFEPFLMLLLGIIIGLIFGSLPGFSSGNTSALMLPLTLGMSTAGAILFIGAIYSTCQYSGGIPAILLGTPGTMGAIATVFDGHSMAKKGEANRAIGLALFSSSIGGLIASIIAIFIVKPIANIALGFGPAEMTLLAVLGLAIISSIAGADVKKGLLCASLGLLVATMGADPTLGLPRLNFGFFELYENVPFIPLILGFFAFPSIIDMVNKENIFESNIKVQIKMIKDGVIEAARKPFVILRSSIIGLFVGIIPGAGIDIGSFMSYSIAKSLSRSPETFGKGNPEGIIAPEAANNGVSAGALVPALSLGIPGGTTAAIMLSALTLHGVRIGPQVVKDYPGEVYALFLGIIICSIVIFPLGWLYTKMALKITAVNTAYLIPAVLVLCITGSFAARELIFDSYICFIGGILGIIMAKENYPIAPFILGFVLGPIVETNFIRSILISRGDLSIFISSPICITMWVIIFITILLPLVIKVIYKKQETYSTK